MNDGAPESTGRRTATDHHHRLVSGGPGHSHLLFVHADSGVHRLAPECKLVATVLFVFAVVATPRDAYWAFAGHAAILATVAMLARVPVRRIARRLAPEVPFLTFAVFLPIVGPAPDLQIGFLELSQSGLASAWNILVKGTLGVAATAILTATTTIPQRRRP